MKENTYNTYLIHIKPLELLTKDEYEKIYSVIFARRNPQEHPTIRSCLYHLAVGTQVKIKQNEEGEDDEILISWRIEKNITELKRFKSSILSVYSEHDREYKLLHRRDKHFNLLGTNVIRLLSPPEASYLSHQLDTYVEKYLPRKVMKILN